MFSLAHLYDSCDEVQKLASSRGIQNTWRANCGAVRYITGELVMACFLSQWVLLYKLVDL